MIGISTKRNGTIQIWLVALSFVFAHAMIGEIPLPKSLEKCFRSFATQTSISQTVGQAIGYHCNLQFAWREAGINGWLRHNITRQEYEWFSSLLYLPNHRTKGRKKKYARKPEIRIRKEIRALSEKERADYHRAIQLLKTDTSIPPNKYDSFNSLHQGMTTTASHGGPNFLGWHRVFLLMFENALRQKVPTVTVPYWASFLDSKLQDPAKSIVWSELFFGNGNGLVRTGPYADWITKSGPLIRNIGDSGGYLFRENGIKNILRQHRTFDITEPFAAPDNNLEFLHGRVHNYIDGQMSELATSSQDPIFFVHHSFVDFIWEVFREKQRKRGIDPQVDYPDIVNHTLHLANAPLGFGSLRNIDSFHNSWIDGIYSYAPIPTCSLKHQDCGSPYLNCVINNSNAYCVSKTTSSLPRQPVTNTRTQAQQDLSDPTGGSSASSQTFSTNNLATEMMSSTNSGSSVAGQQLNVLQNNFPRTHFAGKFQPIIHPKILGRRKRSGNSFNIPMSPTHSMLFSNMANTGLPIDRTGTENTNRIQNRQLSSGINTFEGRFFGGMIPQLLTPSQSNDANVNITDNQQSQTSWSGSENQDQCPAIPINNGFQNTFNINGRADIRQWVYLPIKIISRRPPNFKIYPSFPVMDGEVSQESDIYSPSRYTMLKDRFVFGNLATNPTCQNGNTDSGKVFVQSNGINYHGTYKEYAVVDRRLAISIATAFVAVKNPASGATDVMLSAFDSCERVCMPFCRIPESNTGETRPCSGAIRVTSAHPKLYGMDYGEAVLGAWSLMGSGACPRLDDNHVFISFYCDYVDKWPFVGTEAPPRPSAPVSPIQPVQRAPIAPNVACHIGQGCVINDYCRPCMNGVIRPCQGMCALYAQCQAGIYRIQRCQEGLTFDIRYQTCVAGNTNCLEGGITPAVRNMQHFNPAKRETDSSD